MTTRTAVKYDKQAKSWQAINGETHDFGPGKDAKRQALLAALAHDHPTLHEIVTDLARMNNDDPKVLDRLLKGCQLLVKGRVYQTNHKNRYRVKSQSSDVVYQVVWDGIPAAYRCICEDFENGLKRLAGEAQYGGCDVDLNPWPVCKHILAAHIAWISKWPLQDEPIPWDGR